MSEQLSIRGNFARLMNGELVGSDATLEPRVISILKTAGPTG